MRTLLQNIVLFATLIAKHAKMEQKIIVNLAILVGIYSLMDRPAKTHAPRNIF